MSDTDIRTLPGLTGAIGNWLDGPDDRLLNAIPNMIALAEADFRRNLVMPEQEVQITIDPSADALPTDIDSIRSFAILGSWQRELLPVPVATFYDLPQDATGQPERYAITNGTLLLWPTADTTYQAKLTYRQTIPALIDDAPTNWLLTAHPDAYLFGALLQAEFFGWNDERLPIIQAKLSSIIDDVNKAGQRKRYGGRLVMQPAVNEGLSRWRA